MAEAPARAKKKYVVDFEWHRANNNTYPEDDDAWVEVLRRPPESWSAAEVAHWATRPRDQCGGELGSLLAARLWENAIDGHLLLLYGGAGGGGVDGSGRTADAGGSSAGAAGVAGELIRALGVSDPAQRPALAEAIRELRALPDRLAYGDVVLPPPRELLLERKPHSGAAGRGTPGAAKSRPLPSGSRAPQNGPVTAPAGGVGGKQQRTVGLSIKEQILQDARRQAEAKAAAEAGATAGSRKGSTVGPGRGGVHVVGEAAAARTGELPRGQAGTQRRRRAAAAEAERGEGAGWSDDAVPPFDQRGVAAAGSGGSGKSGARAGGEGDGAGGGAERRHVLCELRRMAELVAAHDDVARRLRVLRLEGTGGLARLEQERRRAAEQQEAAEREAVHKEEVEVAAAAAAAEPPPALTLEEVEQRGRLGRQQVAAQAAAVDELARVPLRRAMRRAATQAEAAVWGEDAATNQDAGTGGGAGFTGTGATRVLRGGWREVGEEGSDVGEGSVRQSLSAAGRAVLAEADRREASYAEDPWVYDNDEEVGSDGGNVEGRGRGRGGGAGVGGRGSSRRGAEEERRRRRVQQQVRARPWAVPDLRGEGYRRDDSPEYCGCCSHRSERVPLDRCCGGRAGREQQRQQRQQKAGKPSGPPIGADGRTSRPASAGRPGHGAAGGGGGGGMDDGRREGCGPSRPLVGLPRGKGREPGLWEVHPPGPGPDPWRTADLGAVQQALARGASTPVHHTLKSKLSQDTVRHMYGIAPQEEGAPHRDGALGGRAGGGRAPGCQGALGSPEPRPAATAAAALPFFPPASLLTNQRAAAHEVALRRERGLPVPLDLLAARSVAAPREARRVVREVMPPEPESVVTQPVEQADGSVIFPSRYGFQVQPSTSAATTAAPSHTSHPGVSHPSPPPPPGCQPLAAPHSSTSPHRVHFAGPAPGAPISAPPLEASQQRHYQQPRQPPAEPHPQPQPRPLPSPPAAPTTRLHQRPASATTATGQGTTGLLAPHAHGRPRSAYEAPVARLEDTAFGAFPLAPDRKGSGAGMWSAGQQHFPEGDRRQVQPSQRVEGQQKAEQRPHPTPGILGGAWVLPPSTEGGRGLPQGRLAPPEAHVRGIGQDGELRRAIAAGAAAAGAAAAAAAAANVDADAGTGVGAAGAGHGRRVCGGGGGSSVGSGARLVPVPAAAPVWRSTSASRVRGAMRLGPYLQGEWGDPELQRSVRDTLALLDGGGGPPANGPGRRASSTSGRAGQRPPAAAGAAAAGCKPTQVYRFRDGAMVYTGRRPPFTSKPEPQYQLPGWHPRPMGQDWTKTDAERLAGCVSAEVRGNTELHWAAGRGDTGRVVELLREAGGPEERRALVARRNRAGETPLHRAAACRGASAVAAMELLLAEGAETDPRDVLGRTPLMAILTAECWLPEGDRRARTLLAAGARVDVCDCTCESLLHKAIIHNVCRGAAPDPRHPHATYRHMGPCCHPKHPRTGHPRPSSPQQHHHRPTDPDAATSSGLAELLQLLLAAARQDTRGPFDEEGAEGQHHPPGLSHRHAGSGHGTRASRTHTGTSGGAFASAHPLAAAAAAGTSGAFTATVVSAAAAAAAAAGVPSGQHTTPPRGLGRLPPLHVNTRDAHGRTALHLACSRPHLHGPGVEGCSVEVLLGAGADPDAVDGVGRRPLHWVLAEAAMATGLRGANAINHAKLGTARPKQPPGALCRLVEQLLRGGADPSALEVATGYTPVHLAVMARSLPLLRLLLRSRADARVRDAKDRTPGDMLRSALEICNEQEERSLLSKMLELIGKYERAADAGATAAAGVGAAVASGPSLLGQMSGAGRGRGRSGGRGNHPGLGGGRGPRTLRQLYEEQYGPLSEDEDEAAPPTQRELVQAYMAVMQQGGTAQGHASGPTPGLGAAAVNDAVVGNSGSGAPVSEGHPVSRAGTGTSTPTPAAATAAPLVGAATALAASTRCFTPSAPYGPEHERAAITIQAAHRGRMARRQYAQSRAEAPRQGQQQPAGGPPAAPGSHRDTAAAAPAAEAQRDSVAGGGVALVVRGPGATLAAMSSADAAVMLGLDGRPYEGRHDVAATRIQAAWRGHQARKLYHHVQQAAAQAGDLDLELDEHEIQALSRHVSMGRTPSRVRRTSTSRTRHWDEAGLDGGGGHGGGAGGGGRDGGGVDRGFALGQTEEEEEEGEEEEGAGFDGSDDGSLPSGHAIIGGQDVDGSFPVMQYGSYEPGDGSASGEADSVF